MRYLFSYKQLPLLLFFIVFFNCKEESRLSRIEGDRLEINDSLKSDANIEAFIAPYREHVNKNLDSILAYAPKTLSKDDGEFNTPIGNLMADIVMEQALPIVQKQRGQTIDIVALNHGGIRAIIPEGAVSSRTAFKVMPFENMIAIVYMTGDQLMGMIDYLVENQRAHPISGMQLILNSEGGLHEVTVRGEPISSNRTYIVATSDYLYNGGDRMKFFKDSDSVYIMEYKIRNAMIDYFKKVDTLKGEIDNRFIKLN